MLIILCQVSEVCNGYVQALQRMLHARQLGLKLIANTTFGYTAANYSGRMPCIEVCLSVCLSVTQWLTTVDACLALRSVCLSVCRVDGF